MTGDDVTTASVVIATYNKRPYLELTLASLTMQDHPAFDVVICDDGTPGGIRDIVDAYRDRLDVRLVEQANGGRASARNRALAAATGSIVIFNDDDRIVEPNFVSAHVARHTENSIATIGWKRRCVTFWIPDTLPLSEADLRTLMKRGVSLDEPCRLLEVTDVLTDFDAAMERVGLGDERDNHVDVVAHFGDDLAGLHFAWVLGTTANMAVSRDALSEIGGFDVDFDGWGAEDTDLGYRLHRTGVRFVVERGAINHHQIHRLGESALPVAQRAQQQQLLRNIDHFCRKHPALETYLFRRRSEHRLTLMEANRLYEMLQRPEMDVVQRELTALYARS